MKNRIVTPILAIVIVAVVLFGGKAALSGTAEKNVEIARNKMMVALLPGSTTFTPEEFDTVENSAIKSVYKSNITVVSISCTFDYISVFTLIYRFNRRIFYCIKFFRCKSCAARQ